MTACSQSGAARKLVDIGFLSGISESYRGEGPHVDPMLGLAGDMVMGLKGLGTFFEMCCNSRTGASPFKLFLGTVHAFISSFHRPYYQLAPNHPQSRTDSTTSPPSSPETPSVSPPAFPAPLATSRPSNSPSRCYPLALNRSLSGTASHPLRR